MKRNFAFKNPIRKTVVKFSIIFSSIFKLSRIVFKIRFVFFRSAFNSGDAEMRLFWVKKVVCKSASKSTVIISINRLIYFKLDLKFVLFFNPFFVSFFYFFRSEFKSVALIYPIIP